MPIQVERLPGEPILIATCSGALDVAALRDMFAQTAALLQAADTVVYRIADYHAVTSSFDDLLRAAREASQDSPPASTTDPRIRPVFVGSDEWQAQARAAFGEKPFQGVQIPIFGSVEQAISAIRQQQKD